MLLKPFWYSWKNCLDFTSKLKLRVTRSKTTSLHIFLTICESHMTLCEWYLHNLQIIQIPTFKVYHVQEYNFNNSKNSSLTWKQLIFCAQYMQRLKASTDMCFFFYIAQYSCKYLTNILTYSHWHYN